MRYSTTLVNSFAATPTLEWDTLAEALDYVETVASNGMTVTLAPIN